MIDVNAMRRADIGLHGLVGTDVAYTLYYDETNNDRRLHVRPTGLNVRDPKCFVLGGVGHRGARNHLDPTLLRAALEFQPSVKEMKFKNLAAGDLLQALDAPRMEIFVDWLEGQDLFLHYLVVDPIYWSLVDIVDSIIAEQRAANLAGIAFNLKNDLYETVRRDLPGLIDLYRRCDYPNVGRERRGLFLAELMALLEARRELMPDFNFQMLKGVLQIGEKLERLPFLEDGVPHVLIDHYAQFFINKFCLFKNADHILDVETEIQARLSRLEFVDDSRPFVNFRFTDSKAEAGVQISDVVVGLLGRLFTFVNRTERDEIRVARDGLSPRQSRVLRGLSRLLDRSIEENQAFAHTVVSLEDRYRAAIFLGQED